MKIIQASAYPRENGGGSEKYCFELSRRLASMGHEVHVLTSRMYQKDGHTHDGMVVHHHRCLGLLGGINPATLIHRVFREEADVIHAHSYIFLTTNQSALARRLGRSSLLIHLHGGLDTSECGDMEREMRAKRIYDPTLGRWTLQSAEGVASVSRRDMQLAKRIFSLDGVALRWLPNAVDTGLFRSRDHDWRPNIIFVGRLEHRKGFGIFLEIVRRLSDQVGDATFTVLGDGSLAGLLDQERRNLGERLFAPGKVAKEEVAAMLAMADILVLPSFVEGLPTVCLEALASGVPVVASDVGGTGEVVIDGETGCLIPRPDASLFTEAILRLLDSPSLCLRLGKRGRRLIHGYYSWSEVVRRTQETYCTIAS